MKQLSNLILAVTCREGTTVPTLGTETASGDSEVLIPSDKMTQGRKGTCQQASGGTPRRHFSCHSRTGRNEAGGKAASARPLETPSCHAEAEADVPEKDAHLSPRS